MDGLRKKATKKTSSLASTLPLPPRKPIHKKPAKPKRTQEDEQHTDKVSTILGIFDGQCLSEEQCMLALGAIGYSAKECQSVMEALDEVLGELEPAYPKPEIYAACDRIKPSSSEKMEAFSRLCEEGANAITLASLQKVLANALKAGHQRSLAFRPMDESSLRLITDWLGNK